MIYHKTSSYYVKIFAEYTVYQILYIHEVVVVVVCYICILYVYICILYTVYHVCVYMNVITNCS